MASGAQVLYGRFGLFLNEWQVRDQAAGSVAVIMERVNRQRWILFWVCVAGEWDYIAFRIIRRRRSSATNVVIEAVEVGARNPRLQVVVVEDRVLHRWKWQVFYRGALRLFSLETSDSPMWL
jgi:hypothetical protein